MRVHRTSRLALLVLLPALLAAAPAAERLRYDVGYLASDSLEGRRAGSPGADLAAGFIARRFAALGLEPAGEDGFLQPFSFISGVRPGPGNRLALTLPGGPRTASAEEFNPLAFSSSGEAAGPVVFAGYGIHAPDLGYDDFAGLDLTGKVALVLRFSPDGDDPDSRFQPYMTLRRKAADARQAGAVALLVATGPVGSTDAAPVKIRFDSSFADSGLPVLAISTSLAEELFAGQGFSLADLQKGINERQEPASRPLGVQAQLTADVVQERAASPNVLALLRGSSPELRDELIVIGAHYDHLGWGGEGSSSLEPGARAVHNGADDNASGVAAMLEIARALAARPPARSVLFVAFSGEEVGLLGSAHLVATRPNLKDDVVAMLNLDMVGRPKDGRGMTVGGFGTAAEWPALVERANAGIGMKLSTSAGGFGASDHSSFYAAGVPVLFLFTGAHGDYHRPSDDPATLDYAGLARVVRFATEITRAVADAPSRPTFQRVADEPGGGRRSFKVRTGVIPEFGYDGPGLRISGVRGGSPADVAGLVGGDIVVRFGERDVRNIYDYMYALGDHQAGEQVTLVVQREDRRLELSVTLEAGGQAGR